jgi:hypothetical protein
MKMGTTRPPWRYDAALDGTLPAPDAHLTGPMLHDAKQIHSAAKRQT